MATVDDRLGALADRPGEFLDHAAQRLAVGNTWRGDVANAVARHDREPLGLRADLYAAVVYLDALLDIEVVPNDHLLAAAHRHAPRLDRRHPAQVEMGNHMRSV